MAETTPAPTGGTGINKTYIIVGVIILVLLIGLLVWAYFSGKKKGKSASTVEITTPPTDSGQGVSEMEVNSLAEELHREMVGANWLGHDLSPWKRLLALSDTDFIRVNNRFNTQYQAESGESFYDWVSDEASGGSGSSWDTIQSTVQTRLKKLNVK